MILSKTLSNKSFAVYGLGVTGLSVLNCLKKSKVKNYVIKNDDLTTKKPGTGIPLSKKKFVIGKKLRKNVSSNRLLKLQDIY